MLSCAFFSELTTLNSLRNESTETSLTRMYFRQEYLTDTAAVSCSAPDDVKTLEVALGADEWNREHPEPSAHHRRSPIRPYCPAEHGAELLSAPPISCPPAQKWGRHGEPPTLGQGSYALHSQLP